MNLQPTITDEARRQHRAHQDALRRLNGPKCPPVPVHVPINEHADEVEIEICVISINEPVFVGDMTRIQHASLDHNRRISIRNIQEVVASHYEISVFDMCSARRTHELVRPRQFAMYLAKMLTLKSMPEIGRRFGGRDHTTALHAVRKFEHLVRSDPETSDEAKHFTSILAGKVS
jgi:hypothetical protein